MRTYLWTWGFIQIVCLLQQLIFEKWERIEWLLMFAAPPVAALAVVVLCWYKENYGVPVVVIEDRTKRKY